MAQLAMPEDILICHQKGKSYIPGIQWVENRHILTLSDTQDSTPKQAFN